MVVSITCIHEKIDRFRAGLRKSQDYIKRRVDEEGRKMLSALGAWMAERVFQVQQTHFKVSKMTVKQHTSG